VIVSAPRILTPDELVLDGGPSSAGLAARPLLVLVGPTGAGKTTTVERLCTKLELAGVLPNRRALTDRIILPMMTGNRDQSVVDRVERFRLTAEFKQRHPGGMGDVLGRLALPADLPPGLILFDGLRGAAEVSAAASTLPRARFLVLDCAPELRLGRLCGRNDPFDRAAVTAVEGETAGAGAVAAALEAEGFDTLVDPDVLRATATALAADGIDPSAVARAAAIIVEEARYYDSDAARQVLARLAPGRMLSVDTAVVDPDAVAALVAAAFKPD
jgi:hypothetical protein